MRIQRFMENSNLRLINALDDTGDENISINEYLIETKLKFHT